VSRRERERPGDEDQAGRRRHRWSEFRDAYPRIVAGMAIFIGVLLVADAVFTWRWLRYRRETREMRASLNAAERGRLDLLLEATGQRAQLMMEVARREARGADQLNLAVSLDDGVMYLQRQGARLREMKVRIGPEATVGEAPGAIKIAAPRGKRTVVRMLSGAYEYELPAWVWTQRGMQPPSNRRAGGALGPVAIVLSGGVVIYSEPAPSPLEPGHPLPGAVLADRNDLDAILENVKPGMPVYFH
jgi:hypothetical protein